MSIFYLGAKPRIVPKEELLPEMYEDRYFLPGVIHGGEDYLIRVYLNDSHCESGIYSDEEYGDHAQFCIEYITADLIKEARELDPLLGDEFYQKLFEGENFCCDNDGKGDFAGIVDEWPKAMYLSRSELVDWAASIAERNPDPDYKEIFVYLRRNDDGLVYQDLAIVGEEYSIQAGEDGEHKVVPIHGHYSVKVYSDPNNEDFQHDFLFGRHLEATCPYSEQSQCTISPDENVCNGSELEQGECAYRKEM